MSPANTIHVTFLTVAIILQLLPYTKSSHFTSTSTSISRDFLNSGKNLRGATVASTTSIDESEVDYNIAELQDTEKRQCYLGYINRTEDVVYCNSTNGVARVLEVGHPCISRIDDMIACDVCCIGMLDICPYLSHKTKSQIASIKFWLDGVIKVFIFHISKNDFKIQVLNYKGKSSIV